MSLPSTLRLSSLLHRLPPPSRRYFSFLHHRSVSDLRFSSSSPRIRPVVQSRRREEPATDDSENGSLLVKDPNGGSPGGGNGRVVQTELHKEATEAYMAYAMSVLLGRALPDVRDGLKPVHRRILWDPLLSSPLFCYFRVLVFNFLILCFFLWIYRFAMHELGLSSKKPFKKCARVVGEVSCWIKLSIIVVTNDNYYLIIFFWVSFFFLGFGQVSSPWRYCCLWCTSSNGAGKMGLFFCYLLCVLIAETARLSPNHLKLFSYNWFYYSGFLTEMPSYSRAWEFWFGWCGSSCRHALYRMQAGCMF